MPFIYSANRQKIELTLSADDIGVRFESQEVAPRAFRAARAAFSTRAAFSNGHAAPESLPRRFGRVMLLNHPGASRSSFATVRDALPSRMMRDVKRTLPVFTENESGLRVIATREVTVRFKPKTSEKQRQKALAGLKMTEDRASSFAARQFVVRPTEDIDETGILELANTLCEYDDLIEYAAPNFVSEYRKSAVPNDPRLNAQWHLNNTGAKGALAGEDVDALLAWRITPGVDPNVVIAIVDDGVDLDHRDLKRNIWVNPNPNAPDRNGRNFYDDDFDPRPRHFNRPFDVTDFNDIHGTPCAGVAAAVGNNRQGVVGIAHRCKVLAVKIFGADSIAPNDRVADSIRYAGMRAQVISNSWGGPPNPDLEAAINDVTRTGRGGKGCLVFCATGNENKRSIDFPSRYANAIAVGASNDLGKRSGYSNHGPGISFVAPSDDDELRQGITTTDVSIRNRGYNLKGTYTDIFGGTSSATPLAAGIGALVLSVNPGLNWDEARDLLRATAEKIDPRGGNYQDGFSLKYGYGRLNAHQAVVQAQSGPVRSLGGAKKGVKKKTSSAKAAKSASQLNKR